MIEQRRHDYVDALRGVAVLMVVMAHTPVPPDSAVLTLLNTVGAYGVQLFFILSAFTLFLSLDARRDSEARPILFFFIRRVFRIAPAFYCAAAFYLLKDGLGPRPFAPDGIHLWQILSTLLFVNGWHPESINAVVPGGWSIAVEMTFYLFVPLCFVFVTNAVKALSLALVLALLGMAANAFILPYIMTGYSDQPTLLTWFPTLWFPVQACVFPIGFALYHLQKSGRMGIRNSIPASALLMTSVCLVVLFLRWDFFFPRQFLVSLALGLGCFALSQRSFWILVNPAMCHIGKVSFSVYLMHFWVIALVHIWLEPLWSGVAPSFASILFYASVVLGSVVVATATYNLIERPGQLLGRRWIQAIQNRSNAPAVNDSREEYYRASK